MPKVVLSCGAPLASAVPVEVVPAKIAIDANMPNDPKNINFRLPNRSTMNGAMRAARKYSVPFAAAKSLDSSGPNPREFSKTKVA